MLITGPSLANIAGIIDIVAAEGITILNAVTLIIQSSIAGDTNITNDPQIVAGVDGQHLFLIGADDVKTVTFDNGEGLVLEGGVSFIMGLNNTLHLIYNGTVWVEISRSTK